MPGRSQDFNGKSLSGIILNPITVKTMTSLKMFHHNYNTIKTINKYLSEKKLKIEYGPSRVARELVGVGKRERRTRAYSN